MDEIYLTVAANASNFFEIKKILAPGVLFCLYSISATCGSDGGSKARSCENRWFLFGPPVHEKLVVRPKQ
jgi:hypothetical protein